MSFENKVASLSIGRVSFSRTVYAHGRNVAMFDDVHIVGDTLAMVDDLGIKPPRLQIGDGRLPRHGQADDRTQEEKQQQPGSQGLLQARPVGAAVLPEQK